MTHATIAPHGPILCAVSCDIATKDAVKALAGTTFDGDSRAWIVPVMHLPTLKALFDTLTVAPEVVTAYHDLIKRLLCDYCTGRLPADLANRHAVGIAHVLATGWQPTPPPRPQYVAQPEPVPDVPVLDAPDLAIWLRSSRRAVANEERKQAMKRRRQPAH